MNNKKKEFFPENVEIDVDEEKIVVTLPILIISFNNDNCCRC